MRCRAFAPASRYSVQCGAAVCKIGNNPQRSRAIELNPERLCRGYIPDRQIGPVEITQLSGRGRGVTAKGNLQPGNLLFITEPISSTLQGQLGQQLQPQHLLQHWQTGQPGLDASGRFKLSLLHNPSNALRQAASISFKDFNSNKAKKSSVKGFGAAAQQQHGGSSSAAAGAAPLTDEQLQAVVSSNAYGDDHVDAPLAWCRNDRQCSVIGVFPEFAMMNHSCVPNTAAPVLLPSRLLVRSAVQVPTGEELTTSYLGLAGGVPMQQRQQLLQQHYNFTCACQRCKAEAQAPAKVTATLQAMQEWSSQLDTPQLLKLMSEGSASELSELQHKANQLITQLEQQLQQQVTDPLLQQWLRASAYATYAVALRIQDFRSGLRDVNAAQQLADSVRVFAPASEPHLLLLADSAVRAAEAGQRGEALVAGDSQELRVQQLVRAVALRYGEPRDLNLLTQLAGAVTASLSPHWLGLTDLDGQMGLQGLLTAVAAAQQTGSSSTAAAAGTAARQQQQEQQKLHQLASRKWDSTFSS